MTGPPAVKNQPSGSAEYALGGMGGGKEGGV
jgi:hypothetical protein